MREEQAVQKVCPMSLSGGAKINCLGSHCMAWRAFTYPNIVPDQPPVRVGYCGMAGYKDVGGNDD